MFLKEFKKSERGSITVFVLSTMLLVAGVVFTAYFSMMNKSSSQATELNKIQEEYTSSNEMMEQAYNENRPFGAGEIVTNGPKEYTQGDKTARIPEGFMIVPGLDNINEGLVISDNSEDTEKQGEEVVAKGNQYVWIPVTDEEEYVRNRTYVGEPISQAAYTDKDYLPSTIQPSLDGTETDEQIGEKNEEAEKNAVLNAGGFYISRYEAGEENGKTVSKKGIEPLNTITQAESKEKAKKAINTDNVKSALCSGIQWDVIMSYIDQNNLKDGNGNDFDVRTVLAERHKTQINETGENIADKVYNIYDLEGNAMEFVSEKSEGTTYPAVIRGGGWGVLNFASSSRVCINSDTLEGSVGFRYVLYVVNIDK